MVPPSASPRPSTPWLVAASVATLFGCAAAPPEQAPTKEVVGDKVIDVSAEVQRMQLTFRGSPSAGFSAGRGTFRARVDGAGALSVDPITAGANREAPARRGAPVTFRSKTIAGVAASGAPRIEPDGSLRIDRGVAVEEIRGHADGVEQSWIFDRSPAGSGDLVVRLAVSGQRYASATEHGLHFMDAPGGVGVRYGVATWIDAAGERTEVRPVMVGDEIAITVPAAVVARSTWPAVLDPKVLSEIDVDAASATPSHSDPKVSYNPISKKYLVVWQDDSFLGGGDGLYGTLVSASGSVGATFLIDSGLPTQPFAQLTFDGTNYLVVYRDPGSAAVHLLGKRYSPTGTVIDSTPFVVDNDGETKFPTGIATTRDGQTLVVYDHHEPGVGYQGFGARIKFGARVGSPFEIQPSVPLGGGFEGLPMAPKVASDGTNYMFVFSKISNVDPEGVFGRTVSKTAVVGGAFRVSNHRDFVDGVAYGRGTYYTAWSDGRGVGTDTELFGGRITGGVAVDGVGGLPLSADPARDVSPGTLTFDGLNFVVQFADANPPSIVQLMKARIVDKDGATVGSTLTFPAPSQGSAFSASSDGWQRTMVTYSLPATNEIRARIIGGRNGADCFADAECDSGICVNGACCAGACAAASSCVTASCLNDTGTCTQVNTSACSVYCGIVTDPSFGVCSADLSNPWKDADGDGFSDKQETNEYIDNNCNGQFDFGTDSLFPRHAPHNLSSVVQTGAGAGRILPTVTDPKATIGATTYVVTIVAGGFPGTATFNYTVGGGASSTTQVARPVVDISGNVRLAFYKSFTSGDTYTFTTSMGLEEKVADKDRPNIYVQYDYMSWATPGAACTTTADCVSGQPNDVCHAGFCNHEDSPGDPLFRTVVDSFSAHGMKLYIDPVHNALPHSTVVTFARPTDLGNGPKAICAGSVVTAGIGGTAVSFFEIKKRREDLGFGPPFADLRKSVFRYGVIGHYNTCLTDSTAATTGNCTQCPPDRSTPAGTPSANGSGIAELPGDDFIVSMAASFHSPLASVGFNPFLEGGPFMHELGHNLGLHHAGDVATPEWAPNYLSVMSGMYVFNGLQSSGAVGSSTPVESLRTLGYSEHTLRTLKESSLIESDGTAPPSTAGYTGIIQFVDAAGLNGKGPESGTIDWDGTGSTTEACDINDRNGATETMIGYRDWDHDKVSGGDCTTTADCRVNAIRDAVHVIDSSISSKELCVKNRCQPIIHGFQCMPWGIADAPAPPEFVIMHEPDPVTAKAIHTLYPVMEATVDVRPGCGSDWIALGGPGTVPVAILGSNELDATMIVPASLRFAGAPAGATALGDVNGDGRTDLTAQFDMAAVSLSLSSTTATLRGYLTDSQAFQAIATVTVVSAPGPVVTIFDDGTGYSSTLVNPFNKDWIGYTLADCVTSAVDHCGTPLSVNLAGSITKITSDETDDGPDMQILGNSSFQVRQERNGSGDGRVYTVHFTVTSGGDSTATSCRIQVRHHVGAPNAVDSGPKECVGSCP